MNAHEYAPHVNMWRHQYQSYLSVMVLLPIRQTWNLSQTLHGFDLGYLVWRFL